MGKTSGSFKKGQGGNRKGIKNKKTQVKEAIGLDSWENLQRYLLNEGADKFIEEVSKMKGHAFAINFLQAIEYFKPKLARTESNVNVKAEVKNFVIELSKESDSGNGDLEKI